MFSEWAPITILDYNYGKGEKFCTHYNFMGNRATAYWKPSKLTPPDLTISRLSPIQTRALCTSDIHDIPRLIQEAEQRLVFFKSQQPLPASTNFVADRGTRNPSAGNQCLGKEARVHDRKI